MKSEVWKIIINSVICDLNLQTPIYIKISLPYCLTSQVGVHTPPQRSDLLAIGLQWQRQVILRDLYSRINQGILANLQRIRLREGAARCWLRKKSPRQTDRQTPTPHLQTQRQSQQAVSSDLWQKGFPLPDTTFPSWFSWDSSLRVSIQAPCILESLIFHKRLKNKKKPVHKPLYKNQEYNAGKKHFSYTKSTLLGRFSNLTNSLSDFSSLFIN